MHFCICNLIPLAGEPGWPAEKVNAAPIHDNVVPCLRARIGCNYERMNANTTTRKNERERGCFLGQQRIAHSPVAISRRKRADESLEGGKTNRKCGEPRCERRDKPLLHSRKFAAARHSLHVHARTHPYVNMCVCVCVAARSPETRARTHRHADTASYMCICRRCALISRWNY